MNLSKEEELEKIKAMVVGKVHLDPTFQQQFIQKPEESVLKISEKISAEDAKKIVEEAKPFISPIPGYEAKDFKALVEDVTDRVNTGFNEILMMSKILFYLGVAIIIVAVGLDIGGVIYKINWQQFIASSGVLGGIGILAVFSSFVKGSFEKIKNSIGDLVQIQVIFFGYYDQLSILMPQRVGADFETATKITDKISSSMNSALEGIQKYCEVTGT